MIDDPKLAKVIDAGLARGLKVVPKTFANETRTSADAARAVGCDVSQIVKSLIFDSDVGPVLFLVSGANRLDPDKGAASVGAQRLERLDASRAKRVTGYSIGATPPLGLASEVPVVMDDDLMRHDIVWAAAGRTDSVFPASPDELARAAGATVARVKV